MIEIYKQLLTCNWNYAAYRAFLPNNIHWPYFHQLQEHPSHFFCIDKNLSKLGGKKPIKNQERYSRSTAIDRKSAGHSGRKVEIK